jgi:hypothetical protein
MNKAPVLILNAATLNTGHNWQFTASYMGEPPTGLNTEIDSSYRLWRMYYKHAPKRYQQFRLGEAVAASSCVPGIFEPLTLDGLYPYDDGKLKDDHLISVRLVDGGVCDNQGIASLKEQDCTVMLLSDASGQMGEVNNPSRGPFGVLLRSSSVVQARVRELQYAEFIERRQALLARGMFVHLCQDLPGSNVAWRDCPSSLKESDFEIRKNNTNDATNYGVAASVQRLLSKIRTDLDSFNDAEAFALMASAYRMTAAQFEGSKKTVDGFPPPESEVKWRFLSIENAMKPRSVIQDEARRKYLEELLDAAGSAAFKVWTLSPFLRILSYILCASVIVGVSWGLYEAREVPLSPSTIYARVEPYLPAWIKQHVPTLTFGFIGKLILSYVVLAVIAFFVNMIAGRKYGRNILQAICWRDTLKSIAIGLGMSTLGFIVVRIHLHVFDRIYLRLGRLSKFPK